MNRIFHIHWICFAILIAICSLPASYGQEISVFELPQRMQEFTALQKAMLQASAGRRLDEATRLAENAVERMPILPNGYYNLACLHAVRGDVEGAFRNLEEAIDRGLNASDHIRKDQDLVSLHSDARWQDLLERSKQPGNNRFKQQVTPLLIDGNVAKVEEGNTLWDPNSGWMRTFFKLPPESEIDEGEAPSTIVLRPKAAGQLVNRWWSEGTAAGLHGVLYDNHDRAHSTMDTTQFPQLSSVTYNQSVRGLNLDHGLQKSFLFNAITIGNSSTSLIGTGWRSQARLAYTNPLLARFIATQYISNHLYIYPEHRDHDPQYGDTFPANTPYVTVTQGSSYSDRPVLSAFALTIAAMRPDVQRLLQRNRMIAPTVQMILRRSYDAIDSDEDYLSGLAHPTVFDPKKINAERMVTLAHEITSDAAPPLTVLNVVAESQSIVGRDYFDVGPRETLLTSGSAIARICRNVAHDRTMTVTAKGSKDPNGMPLTFHWRVLRGDPSKISIQPHRGNSATADIRVGYHKRMPIVPNSEMLSHRVDIGVFTHNGKHYSAPAMISFSWPSNEVRVYDEKDRIQQVIYQDVDDAPYFDPLIITPCKWRDEYEYAADGKLMGWTRHHANQRLSFTAAGLLVKSRDDLQRPLLAEKINYVAKARPKQPTLLTHVRTGKIYQYQYEGPADKIGKPVDPDSEDADSGNPPQT